MHEVISFYAMVNDDSEPPAPIISDGVLLDNTILEIIGEAKARKSFLALNFAVAIAKGDGFAGFKVSKPQKVLVLSAEGGFYPNRERIKKITMNESDDTLKNVHYLKYANISIDNDSHYDDLTELIRRTNPKVVIFDPLIKFHSQDENSSSGMSIVFRRFREIIENFNLSIVVVHHTGKNLSQGGRGSSFMTGEYDSCITLSKARSGENNHRIRFDMRHVETTVPWQLIFNAESFWFEVNDTVKDATVDYLVENGSTSRSEVVNDWISNDTFSRSYCYKVIDKSLEAGHIVEQDGLLMLPAGEDEEET